MATATNIVTERERRTYRQRRQGLDLLKGDRRRRIDRYIDYFGDRTRRAPAARRILVTVAMTLA
jgi:hypothetical protein